MYTLINAFATHEIVVIGFTEAAPEELGEGQKIDVTFRIDHSHDDIVEPEIGRTFGILVSEDEFSAAGGNAYMPPAISAKETALTEFFSDLSRVAQL